MEQINNRALPWAPAVFYLLVAIENDSSYTQGPFLSLDKASYLFWTPWLFIPLLKVKPLSVSVVTISSVVPTLKSGFRERGKKGLGEVMVWIDVYNSNFYIFPKPPHFCESIDSGKTCDIHSWLNRSFFPIISRCISTLLPSPMWIICIRVTGAHGHHGPWLCHASASSESNVYPRRAETR